MDTGNSFLLIRGIFFTASEFDFVSHGSVVYRSYTVIVPTLVAYSNLVRLQM